MMNTTMVDEVVRSAVNGLQSHAKVHAEFVRLWGGWLKTCPQCPNAKADVSEVGEKHKRSA
jgi:hypothetical protein